MIRKLIRCILFCLLLTPEFAFAQETVSILELRATAPDRWICGIQINDGKTVTIDAPVHIPDVEAVPLLMVSEAPFIYELAGDESFIVGKADVRRREEILDPNRFSEIGYPPEDLLDFMQEKLSSHGVTDIELVLYRTTALGPMCHVKQGKTYNKKYSFPCSVADTEKPWKNDTTRGYEITATHRVAGMPVFLSGTVYPVDSDYTRSWLYYIDKDHYSIGWSRPSTIPDSPWIQAHSGRILLPPSLRRPGQSYNGTWLRGKYDQGGQAFPAILTPHGLFCQHEPGDILNDLFIHPGFPGIGS